MPNWCSNRLNIYNPKVFKEKCVKNGIFSFDKFIPTPKHIRAWEFLCMSSQEDKEFVEAGLTTEAITSREALCNQYFWKKAFDYMILKPWMDKEAERTGLPTNSWYDWNYDNWGTKWDVAHDDFDLEDLDEAIEDDEQYDFTFDTAWGPPEPVLHKMAELGVDFSWYCEESGNDIYMEGEVDETGAFKCSDVKSPE